MHRDVTALLAIGLHATHPYTVNGIIGCHDDVSTTALPILLQCAGVAQLKLPGVDDPLRIAARIGDADRVQMVLELVDPKHHVRLLATHEGGGSALSDAVGAQSVAAVQVLTRACANVMADAAFTPALLLRATTGNVAVVTALLQNAPAAAVARMMAGGGWLSRGVTDDMLAALLPHANADAAAAALSGAIAAVDPSIALARGRRGIGGARGGRHGIGVLLSHQRHDGGVLRAALLDIPRPLRLAAGGRVTQRRQLRTMLLLLGNQLFFVASVIGGALLLVAVRGHALLLLQRCAAPGFASRGFLRLPRALLFVSNCSLLGQHDMRLVLLAQQLHVGLVVLLLLPQRYVGTPRHILPAARGGGAGRHVDVRERRRRISRGAHAASQNVLLFDWGSVSAADRTQLLPHRTTRVVYHK
jgi:hypothetical protein